MLIHNNRIIFIFLIISIAQNNVQAMSEVSKTNIREITGPIINQFGKGLSKFAPSIVGNFLNKGLTNIAKNGVSKFSYLTTPENYSKNPFGDVEINEHLKATPEYVRLNIEKSRNIDTKSIIGNNTSQDQNNIVEKLIPMYKNDITDFFGISDEELKKHALAFVARITPTDSNLTYKDYSYDTINNTKSIIDNELNKVRSELIIKVQKMKELIKNQESEAFNHISSQVQKIIFKNNVNDIAKVNSVDIKNEEENQILSVTSKENFINQDNLSYNVSKMIMQVDNLITEFQQKKDNLASFRQDLIHEISSFIDKERINFVEQIQIPEIQENQSIKDYYQEIINIIDAVENFDEYKNNLKKILDDTYDKYIKNDEIKEKKAEDIKDIVTQTITDFRQDTIINGIIEQINILFKDQEKPLDYTNAIEQIVNENLKTFNNFNDTHLKDQDNNETKFSEKYTNAKKELIDVFLANEIDNKNLQDTFNQVSDAIIAKNNFEIHAGKDELDKALNPVRTDYNVKRDKKIQEIGEKFAYYPLTQGILKTVSYFPTASIPPVLFATLTVELMFWADKKWNKGNISDAQTKIFEKLTKKSKAELEDLEKKNEFTFKQKMAKNTLSIGNTIVSSAFMMALISFYRTIFSKLGLNKTTPFIWLDNIRNKIITKYVDPVLLKISDINVSILNRINKKHNYQRNR